MARSDEISARRTYDKIAERYHNARANKVLFFNEFLEMPATLSLLPKLKGKKVLDIGCGSGIYATKLKQKGARVCGVDISPRMISIAKQEVSGVDFKVGSVYKLPYLNKSFDIAVAPLVIDYVTDIDRALYEVNRVLRDNGSLIFSLPNPVTQSTERLHKGRVAETSRVFHDYFKEGMRKQLWNYDRKSLGRKRVSVSTMHITYQTLIQSILRNGFVIEDYIDVYPISAGKKSDPKAYALTSKVPWFCAFRVRKTNDR